MPRSDRGTPRFYFSLRSPYSWLAYRKLREQAPDVARVVEWRPFWEPDEWSRDLLAEAGGDFPYVAMSRAKHLYVLRDVRRLVLEEGLSVTWPVDRTPCWEVPHLAYLLARDLGSGTEFIDLAYQARWQEGRDICAPETVEEIAGELGLPESRLRDASHDPELRSRGLEQLLAVDRDGVFGVPFLVSGFDKFWGLDRLPGFIDSVRGLNTPQADLVSSPPPVPVPGGDQGHAGGCG